MSLQAVERRSQADKVFEQLTTEIVAGSYAPGERLPAERELSATLAVNRHVVREAIKRLEQIGLVRVTQGGRTTVQDHTRSAGLDLLAVLAEHAGPAASLAPLFSAALEMRAGIGVDLARLCAERGARDVGPELLEISALLEQAPAGEELLELDRRFWQLVLDGTGNLAYQLAFNSLIRAVHARRELSLPLLERELAQSELRRPIAAAIAAGDPEAAARAARAGLLTIAPARRRGRRGRA